MIKMQITNHGFQITLNVIKNFTMLNKSKFWINWNQYNSGRTKYNMSTRLTGTRSRELNERNGTLPTFSSRRAAKRWAHQDLFACSSLAPQLPRATLAELASMRSCYCVITSDFQIYKLYSARVHRRPAAWGSLMLCPHRPVWLLHLLWTMRLCGRKGVGKTKRFGKKIKKQQQIFADGKILLKVFKQHGAEEEELS